MVVIDFFKDLIRSRVTGIQSAARGKAFGAQARVKGKVAGSFNRAVDGSVAKAMGTAKGKGGSLSGFGAGKPKEKKMGFSLFGRRKKQDQGDAAPPQAEEADAKTQAINIAEFTDTRFKPCVGWVVVMNGPQEGRDFRLVQGRNRIGTDADMEVVLTDPYVSSHHANIVYTDDGTFQLSDAGSTNGTRLNGKKVMQAQLVDNDTLQMGHTTLRFKALY